MTFRVFSGRTSEVTVDPPHRGTVRPNEAEASAQSRVLPQVDGQQRRRSRRACRHGGLKRIAGVADILRQVTRRSLAMPKSICIARPALLRLRSFNHRAYALGIERLTSLVAVAAASFSLALISR